MFVNAVGDDVGMLKYQGGRLKEVSRLHRKGKLGTTVTQTFELLMRNLRRHLMFWRVGEGYW